MKAGESGGIRKLPLSRLMRRKTTSTNEPASVVTMPISRISSALTEDRASGPSAVMVCPSKEKRIIRAKLGDFLAIQFCILANMAPIIPQQQYSHVEPGLSTPPLSLPRPHPIGLLNPLPKLAGRPAWVRRHGFVCASRSGAVEHLRSQLVLRHQSEIHSAQRNVGRPDSPR